MIENKRTVLLSLVEQIDKEDGLNRLIKLATEVFLEPEHRSIAIAELPVKLTGKVQIHGQTFRSLKAAANIWNMNSTQYNIVCRKRRQGEHLDDLFPKRPEPSRRILPTDKNGVALDTKLANLREAHRRNT